MDNQQQQPPPQAQYYYAHQDEMDPDDPYSPSTHSVNVIYPPMMQQQTSQQQLPSAEDHQQQHHPESIQSHSQYVNVDDPMAHSGFADNHNMPTLQQNRFAHHHPLPLSHHNQPFVGIEEYQQAAQQHQQHQHIHQHPQPPPPHHLPVYGNAGQRIGVPPTPIAVAIPTSTPVSVVHTPIVPSSAPIHHHHHQQAYTPITSHPESASPPPISPEPPSPHHSQHSSISSELASYNNNPFHPGGAILTGSGGPGHQTPNTTPSSGAPSPSPSLSSSRSSHHGGGGAPPSSLVHRSSSHTGVHRYHPTASSPSPTQSQASSSGWGPQSAGAGHNRTRSLSYQESPSSLQHYSRPPPPPQQQQQQQELDPDSDQELIDAAEESHISSPPPNSQPPMLAHAYSVMPMHVPSHSSHSHHSNDSGRKEATRRQRIEAEQRRRDELREGYARLKDVLPVTNMKSSKVSLLERAVNHILHLTKMNESLQTRLAAQDSEISRLRMINERIALSDGTPPLGSLQPPPPSQSHEEEREVERAVSGEEVGTEGGDEKRQSSLVKEEYLDADHDSLISSAAGFDP